MMSSNSPCYPRLHSESQSKKLRKMGRCSETYVVKWSCLARVRTTNFSLLLSSASSIEVWGSFQMSKELDLGALAVDPKWSFAFRLTQREDVIHSMTVLSPSVISSE